MLNKLKIKTHLLLLLMSFITWGIFVLVGLPDYYQSWSFDAQVITCIGVTVLYIPLTAFLLRKLFDTNEHFKNAIWLAFYLTVPLFIYDTILLGYIEGEGLSFIPKYWYLSIFYFSFWIQFPLIGLLMEKNNSAK